MIKRVEGVGLDGSTLTLTFGKIEIPAISGTYGDKLETGELSYMGSQEIDEVTQGTYAVDETSFKISSVIFRSVLMPAMPQHGGGVIRMPVVVFKTHPQLGSDSDLLKFFRITNWAAAVANSNTAFEIDLKGKPKQILWTDERKTINLLRGEQLGVSKF